MSCAGYRYQQSERRRLERVTLRFKKVPKVDATKRAAIAAASSKKANETKDGQPIITVSDRDARAERKAAAKLARDSGEEIKIPVVELQTPLTGMHRVHINHQSLHHHTYHMMCDMVAVYNSYTNLTSCHQYTFLHHIAT